MREISFSVRLCWLVLLVGLLLVGVGCFGGEESGELELGLIDFGEDPTPLPVEEQAVEIGILPAFREELSFLYGYQISLEDLQQLTRDLIILSEMEDVDNKDTVGLDWVISVHDVYTVGDQYFELAFAREASAEIREKYSGYYISELEITQVIDHGRKRLLGAAILLGPGGRTVATFDAVERRDFERLIRESKYYLREAENLLEDHLEDVGVALSAVHIR